MGEQGPDELHIYEDELGEDWVLEGTGGTEGLGL